MAGDQVAQLGQAVSHGQLGPARGDGGVLVQRAPAGQVGRRRGLVQPVEARRGQFAIDILADVHGPIVDHVVKGLGEGAHALGRRQVLHGVRHAAGGREVGGGLHRVGRSALGPWRPAQAVG